MENMTKFQQEIATLLPEIELKMNEPLSRHTSFRIGGPAEVMAFPENCEQLAQLLNVSALLDTKPVILGAGTNVLAPDGGMKGLIICLKDCLNGMMRLDERRIRVFAGVTMTRAAVFAASAGLSGLEFAHGIPGTVGGGVYMNAGAYGGEIASACESVDVMSADGILNTIPGDQMGFSYRHSRLEEEFGIVVSAVFRLVHKPESEIRQCMMELMERRKASQPLQLPSAGSAFKRPVTGYAAAMIEHAGLKGFRIGDAAISEKHAGFVVNLGSAKASDVTALLQHVSQKVFNRTGVRLEPEVRIW